MLDDVTVTTKVGRIHGAASQVLEMCSSLLHLGNAAVDVVEPTIDELGDMLVWRLPTIANSEDLGEA